MLVLDARAAVRVTAVILTLAFGAALGMIIVCCIACPDLSKPAKFAAHPASLLPPGEGKEAHVAPMLASVLAAA